MTIDPRTPVLVGGGQVLHRAEGVSDGVEPAVLMARAIQAAAADAGLPAPPAADSLRVVSTLSWRYNNPAYVVAGRLGLEPAELAVTTMGGNSPQALVNETARQILAGDLDVAILVGGEAWRTRMRARREGVDLEWPRAPDDRPPTTIGSEFTMNHQAELDLGIVQPVQVYPMFDTAIRAASGRTPAAHVELISQMWSRFSDVAADNPNAWSRHARSAVEIRTPSPTNRMVGLPYTKYMNANNDVDMAAAVIMCSAAAAGRLGVSSDRWVFPLSGTDCHEHAFVSHRDTFARTPAIEIGGRRALALAGLGIDDVELIDLYSCFPSAVQLGAASLGLDPYADDRQLTRTGGLAFAGGPWNNYVMHAIATMLGELRDRPGEHGLVWANGGYATKHSFGVYSSAPPVGAFSHDSPQAAIDALPRRQLAAPDDAAGPATIEAYTVMHSRDDAPEKVISTCLLDDGRRAWGLTDDSATAAAVCDGEWVGRRVTLDPTGTLLIG
jgi:acetyl-CoA C-acetyltransferase